MRIIKGTLYLLLLSFVVIVTSLSPSQAFAYANTTPIDSGYNNVIITDAAFTATGTMSYTDV